MDLSTNFQKLLLQGNNFIAYNKINSKTQNELPGIIFFTGFKSDMQGTKAKSLTKYCEEKDYNFITFDYLGHGLSSGVFNEGTIGLWLENSLAVIDRLTTGKQILVGSSMGGWLALLTAMLRPSRIAGIIGIAPAPDFTEDLIWNKLDNQQRSDLINKGKITLPFTECTNEYEISLNLIKEARNHLILHETISINCPLYFLHGMEDKDVPYHTSLTLANLITYHDITVKLIKNADHRMSSPADLSLLNNTLDELINKLR